MRGQVEQYPAPVPYKTRSTRIREADYYLSGRAGCYAWRCERYDAAIDAMEGLGLDSGCTVVDVGAGWTEFGHRLAERGHRCRYVPIDAGHDGTDLETWSPARDAEFYVCLEVLEHLRAPCRLLVEMPQSAKRGVIVSTPNPEVTDVLGMDPTHQTPVHQSALSLAGYTVEEASFYGQDADSLFGVWSPLFL